MPTDAAMEGCGGGEDEMSDLLLFSSFLFLCRSRTICCWSAVEDGDEDGHGLAPRAVAGIRPVTVAHRRS